jgi:glycerate 2-kinase
MHSTKKFVIGSGGSAFSDGGFGAIQALNAFSILNKDGQPLGELSIQEVDLIADVKVKDLEFLSEIEIVMPSDVQNPMLGERGAARVYGPQKGATPEQTYFLDQ